MRRIATTARTLSAVLTAAGLLAVGTAESASAAPPCNIGLVWQNTFVPGEDSHFTPNCLLQQGSTGQAVRQLQQGLNTCYGKGLAVDGEYGPLTRAAVRSVQQAVHITADGVYGPQTARATLHVVVSGGGACAHITF
jgi:hypothetical protein